MRLGIGDGGNVHDLGKLPPGDDGVAATVAAIQALVDEFMKPGARPWWLELRVDARSTDNPKKWGRLLYYWLEKHVVFKKDPTGVEFVQKPVDLLRTINALGYARGDCDDMATLAAALTTWAGYRPALATVGRNKPGRFEHIFACVFMDPAGPLVPENLYPLDAQERTGAGIWPKVPRVKLWALTPASL